MSVLPADSLASLRKTRRAVRAPFMLMPLIDVLFLLLIFFMLSSNVSPFAMLQVAAVEDSGSPTDVAPTVGRSLLVRIDRSGLRIDDQIVSLADAPPLLDSLAAPGNVSVVILLGRDATLQDAVSFLDVAASSRFSAVQVVSRGSEP